jgi:hypothetical protein
MSLARTRLLVLPLLLALIGFAPPAVAGAATPPHLKLEKFGLSLINCTRTGGWVQHDGSCKGRGTGTYSKYRPPLKMGPALANLIARPYARKIAKANYCGHDYGGRSITEAFHAAGFYGQHWGESIGCGNWSRPRRDIIETHLMMQAEKSTNGWHWRNMKNPYFKVVGVGVAVVNGTTRIVEDFYLP